MRPHFNINSTAAYYSAASVTELENTKKIFLNFSCLGCKEGVESRDFKNLTFSVLWLDWVINFFFFAKKLYWFSNPYITSINKVWPRKVGHFLQDDYSSVFYYRKNSNWCKESSPMRLVMSFLPVASLAWRSQSSRNWS